MEDLASKPSVSTDDFIHISSSKSTSSSLASFTNSFSKSLYSQVVFHDLSEVYPTDGNISFTYSFQPGVVPQDGDRIALYKIGWTSVSEFITSLYVTIADTYTPLQVNHVTFMVENLPKDETNMYQFCYITSGNIVAGSSIPFTFRRPHGNELVAVEDPNDSGLVVFRSRVTQLQEQLLKSNSEKETLNKNLTELKSELYLLKGELNENQKKHENQKKNIQEMSNMIFDLNTEKKELIEKLETSHIFEKRVEDLQKLNDSLELDISKLKEQISTMENDISSKEAIINELKKVQKYLEDVCVALSRMVDGLQANTTNAMEVTTTDILSKLQQLNNGGFDEIVEILHKVFSSSEESSKSTLEELRNQLKQANFTISHFGTNIDEMEKGFDVKLKHLKEKFLEEKEKYEKQVSSLKNELQEEKNNYEKQVSSLQNEVQECHINLDAFTNSMIEKEKETDVRCNVLARKLEVVSKEYDTLSAEKDKLVSDLGKANTQISALDQLVKNKDNILREIFESSDDSNALSRRLVMTEDENTVLQVQISTLEERWHSCEEANTILEEHNGALKAEIQLMAGQLSKMNEELRHLKHELSQPKSHESAQPSSAASSSQTMSDYKCSDNKESSSKLPFTFSFPFFGPFQSGGALINDSTKCSDDNQTPNHQCDKCVDAESRVKNLLREKADIRSELIQTKHANEEYIRLLKGENEESAALKSRIAVLEIELRKAKEASITKIGEQKYQEMIDTLPWKKSGESSLETSSEFKSLEQEHVDKLKSIKLLELQLQKELETKSLLQKNVEALWLNDAKNYATINGLRKDNAKLTSELDALRKQQAVTDEVVKAIDEMVISKTELSKKLEAVTSEKLQLEKQLTELRKESVGKVSLTTVQDLRNQNDALKQQLIEKGKESASSSTSNQDAEKNESMKDWIIPSSNFQADLHKHKREITCQICGISFPPNCEELYNSHLRDHLD